MGEDDEKTKPARQRVTVPFGDGSLRVEVGVPFTVEDDDGRDEWVCIAKLLGREKPLPWLGIEPPPPVPETEITHTMFLTQGRGTSPEASIKDAMLQLERAYAPTPVITAKPATLPPPRPAAAAAAAAPAAPAAARPGASSPAAATPNPGGAAAAPKPPRSEPALSSYNEITKKYKVPKAKAKPKPLPWLSRLLRRKA